MQRSFEEHFEEGVPWEETELYQYAMENPDIHYLYDPEKNNLEKRLDQMDALYHSMKEEGYKTQRELSDEQLLAERYDEENPWFAPPEVHEIGIAITRSGELAWFYGGNHRLHLAKILELDEIPVRVVVRHREWQELRTEVMESDSIGELGTKARDQLNHPDIRRKAC